MFVKYFSSVSFPGDWGKECPASLDRRGFAKFSIKGDFRLITPFTPLAYINFNDSCNFFC